MKRTHRVATPTTKRKRRRSNLEQIEERVALLLLLLQHNFQKLLEHAKKSS